MKPTVDSSEGGSAPLTLTQALSRIYCRVSKEGFSLTVAMELVDETTLVGMSFGIDQTSAVLLAAILEKAGSDNCAGETSLAKYLGCTYIEFLKHHGRLREMSKKGIIVISKHPGECYRATPEVIGALEENKPFKPLKNTDLTPVEFFSRFKKIFTTFSDDSDNYPILLDNIEYLIRNNTHLAFCREALASELYQSCADGEKCLFYFLCFRYLTEGRAVEDIGMLLDQLGHGLDSVFYRKAFAREETSLQTGDLITFASMDGVADTSMAALTDHVKEDFLCEAEIPEPEVPQYKDLVSVESIEPRDLFFNEVEGKQIARLESLLEEDSFRKVQQRLVESGMRKGFNVLLYGPPGTGKTACAYELARKTGRDVFHVDMTRLRSKWVGDSEKSVKCVFGIYRRLCRAGKKAPILLFNEADAIFSRRFEQVSHSVDQLNNTIQNIILQEMENIEGVLIATTNLVNNLDPAFERRFIYKVEMKVPQKDSRSKIWKAMIGDLTEAEADTLAAEFDFSGGNIENIARKSTVEYVLSGQKPTLASLEDLCRSEALNKNGNRNKIGF